MSCSAVDTGRAARRLWVRDPWDLPPPVILLGMHRSGTSMLAERLRELGFFAGRELDGHFESPWFRRLNDALLARADAAWSEPEPYRRRRSDAEFHRACVAATEAALRRGFARRFLDWSHRFPGLSRPEAPVVWGWKDPRSCLTLSVWRDLFPESKFLHITRHPLDVAISLARREEQRQRMGRRPQPQNADLAHGLALWQAYVEDALAAREAGAAYLEIRYEAFLEEPARWLEAAARFCGLDPDPERLRAGAARIDAARTRRYEAPEYERWREAAAALPAARELGYA